MLLFGHCYLCFLLFFAFYMPSACSLSLYVPIFPMLMKRLSCSHFILYHRLASPLEWFFFSESCHKCEDCFTILSFKSVTLRRMVNMVFLDCCRCPPNESGHRSQAGPERTGKCCTAPPQPYHPFFLFDRSALDSESLLLQYLISVSISRWLLGDHYIKKSMEQIVYVYVLLTCPPMTTL